MINYITFEGMNIFKDRDYSDKYSVCGLCWRVGEVWEQILCDDDFIDYLMPGSKATLCCDFNKYSVMRIVCVLREHGVYEQYSDRKYDALFEPEVKDSPYRKYLGKGINEHYLLIKIRKILCKIKI